MKKVLIAMFTIASFTAMAQDGFRHGPRPSEDPLTPEQMATLQTKRMALALDLTKLQQEQVQEIHLENARIRQEKKEVRKEETGEDSKKPRSAEERFAIQNERLDRMIANKAKMKKILTQEQYGKWEKGMEKRNSHRHHERKHRHGKR